MTEPKLIEQKIKLENGEYLVKKYLVGGFLGKGNVSDIQVVSPNAMRPRIWKLTSEWLLR